MLLYLPVVVFLFWRRTQFSLCNGTMRHNWGWKPLDNQWSRVCFQKEKNKEGVPWSHPARAPDTGVSGLSLALLKHWVDPKWWTASVLPSSCYTRRNWQLLSWQCPLRHAACPNFSKGIRWRVGALHVSTVKYNLESLNVWGIISDLYKSSQNAFI